MVTGAGRGFSSGADLKEMGSQDDRTPEGRPDVRTQLTERYHPIITGIRGMPKPVSPPSTARPWGSAARWRWPATSSWPPSRPTSCSPS